MLFGYTGIAIGNGNNKGILRAQGVKFSALYINLGMGWGNIYMDDGAVDYDSMSQQGTIIE